MTVIRDAEQKHVAYKKAIWKFADDFGSKQIMTTTAWQVHLLGLVFPEKPPDGWRLDQRKGYCVPALKSPEGRVIAERMKALPMGLSACKFSAMMDESTKAKGRSYSVWEGNGVSWTAFEKIGNRYVLSVPAACKISPPGCKELRMSEYWKLREKAGNKDDRNVA